MDCRRISFNRMVLTMITLGAFFGCQKDDPEEPEIPFDRVSGFVISEQGEKLLATGNGLFSLNECKCRYEPVQGELQPSPIHDLAFSDHTPSQELWLAADQGACNFTSQYFLTENNSGLHNNLVTQLHFDRNQIGYFATPGGLSIQDDQEWWYSPGRDDLYEKFEITDIASASNGFTYVTTHGGGIECFKMDVDGISGATVFDTDWTLLESDNIHSVYIDDTTQAYGTDRGAALHFSEYTKWGWEVFTTSDGLINDTVLTAVKDHADQWWFGTIGGISRYDEIQWTSYSVESGHLLNNHIKFSAVDIDGSVWFATDQGLSQYMDGQWIHYSK